MGCRRLHVVINLTEERLSYTCVVNNSPYPADKTQNPVGRVSEAPPDKTTAHPLTSPHPVLSVDQRFAIEKALDHTLRHKRRPIGHMGDDVGIMADQQIGHAVLLFQTIK